MEGLIVFLAMAGAKFPLAFPLACILAPVGALWLLGTARRRNWLVPCPSRYDPLTLSFYYNSRPYGPDRILVYARGKFVFAAIWPKMQGAPDGSRLGRWRQLLERPKQFRDQLAITISS